MWLEREHGHFASAQADLIQSNQSFECSFREAKVIKNRTQRGAGFLIVCVQAQGKRKRWVTARAGGPASRVVALNTESTAFRAKKRRVTSINV